MPDPKNTPAGSEQLPNVTYKNPRRIAAEDSITLRHHRLSRDASRRHNPPFIPNAHSSAIKNPPKYPRRNSSGESNETGWSDPKQWFDQSNQNKKGAFETSVMDVDPPFFQKETDSSNEEPYNVVPSQSPAYRYVQGRTSAFRPGFAQSSSADDYRSVIDDLTIENKRLREELRKFKHRGPDSLRRDKLFEVKVHGLPNRKKRELEAALRDFTTGLEESSTGASTSRNNESGKSKEGQSSVSKHASSSSGSNSRPVDSAYASMSTGAESSARLLPGQARAARIRSNQNIENYLRDIPEGLWPKPAVMTEKDKKKLVVKRLEHIFTGKMGSPAEQLVSSNPPEPIAEDVEMASATSKAVPAKEAAREAKIRPRESNRPNRSHNTRSNSNTHSQSQSHSHSTVDQTNFRDNDNRSGSASGHGSGSGGGSGKDLSPQGGTQHLEQRPTRPRDLDPDRKQDPSENMEYIRHLGLVAPESRSHFSPRDVSPDAEGWVYLNLLCNLAQLHILNVTPDFIRSAVSEKSTKFQLSPDGRKIRWRGGDEGTKFRSDSSGSNSQRNHSSDDTDGSNERDQRKKRKILSAGNDVIAQKGSKFSLGVPDSNSSESFHYKPLFVHHQTSSSDEQPSAGDDSVSSNGQPEESNLGLNSRWGQSGGSTGQSQRKRRRDGAIIYYSGAPFCTDLSGDYGEVSPDTYDMTSSGDRLVQDTVSLNLVHRPYYNRSSSGSLIPYKPLSRHESYGATTDLDSSSTPELTSGETDDEIEADFPWSDRQQQAILTNLEASGLGGVYPEDHFVVVVSTRRPKMASLADDDYGSSGDDYDSSDNDGLPAVARPRLPERRIRETIDSKMTTDLIVGKLAMMSTESPLPLDTSHRKVPAIEIEYLTDKARRLPPVPLPPPTFYFSSDDTGSDDDDDSLDEEYVSSERSVLSKQPMVEGSPDSDNRDLSGNDEEDEHSDGSTDFDPSRGIYSRKMDMMPGIRGGSLSPLPPLSKIATGSSVATAGGQASGYSSSLEDA
ncbi:frequency clock protein [Xylariaceae sp. FL1651]|nr:frequency clock protein [Xylariaceae sp. FL1651]